MALTREEAAELVVNLISSVYGVAGIEEMGDGAADALQHANEECDSLRDRLIDALCEAPATPPGECVLALQAEQELLAWIEKQIEKYTLARDIMDFRLESLGGFRADTAIVIAKMEKFIALE